MKPANEHQQDVDAYCDAVLLGERRAELISEINDIKEAAKNEERSLSSVDHEQIAELKNILHYVNIQKPRIAGRMEINAVHRYLHDCETAESRGLYFDDNLASYACNFFSLMKITQGELAGEEFKLYPWQKFIVWNLFGWYWSATKGRRFQEALIQLARGNGKTPFGAALLFLAGGFMPDVPDRGDNYVTATKRDQAGLAFGDLLAVLKACPDLMDEVTILESKWRITIKRNGCTFNAASSDGKTADGWRVLTVLKDEFHAWDNTKKITEFDSKIKTALGKFNSSLSITITTAGNEQSTKWIEYDKLARMVASQSIELDSFFVFICELDETDDLLDVDNYYKSNPMLEFGIVKKRYLQSLIAKAEISEHDARELERYHANRRVRSTLKPFNESIWALGNDSVDVSLYIPCGGLDLGARDDLTALATVWKLPAVDEENERFKWYCELDCWVPRGGRRDLAQEPWKSWIDGGFLRVTQSDWTDFNAVFARIRERQELHGWNTIAVDKWQARQISIDMENEGIKTYEFDQANRKFHEPCEELRQAVNEQRFFHGGNPLLAWTAMNYVTASDSSGYVKPDKASSEEKIDPIVAAIMALSEGMFGEVTPISKYEKSDLVVFGVDNDGGVDMYDVDDGASLYEF